MSTNIYQNGQLIKTAGVLKVDDALSTVSPNPVMNSVVSTKISDINSSITTINDNIDDLIEKLENGTYKGWVASLTEPEESARATMLWVDISAPYKPKLKYYNTYTSAWEGIGGGSGGFVAQNTAPTDTTVLWIDTSDTTAIVMKYYNNTNWVSISGAGSGWIMQDTAPTKTSLMWVDTSGDTPLIKVYLNDAWVAVTSDMKIDDTTTSEKSLWSSQKISDTIAPLQTNSHSHTNKSTLDKLTEDENNVLLFDGEKIQTAVSEAENNIITMKDDGIYASAAGSVIDYVTDTVSAPTDATEDTDLMICDATLSAGSVYLIFDGSDTTYLTITKSTEAYLGYDFETNVRPETIYTKFSSTSATGTLMYSDDKVNWNDTGITINHGDNTVYTDTSARYWCIYMKLGTSAISVYTLNMNMRKVENVDLVNVDNKTLTIDENKTLGVNVSSVDKNILEKQDDGLYVPCATNVRYAYEIMSTPQDATEDTDQMFGHGVYYNGGTIKYTNLYKLYDGDSSTYITTDVVRTAYIGYDFLIEVTPYKVVYSIGGTLQYSNDNTTWTTLQTIDKGTSTFSTSISARYWRIQTAVGGNSQKLYSLEIYTRKFRDEPSLILHPSYFDIESNSDMLQVNISSEEKNVLQAKIDGLYASSDTTLSATTGNILSNESDGLYATAQIDDTSTTATDKGWSASKITTELTPLKSASHTHTNKDMLDKLSINDSGYLLYDSKTLPTAVSAEDGNNISNKEDGLFSSASEIQYPNITLKSPNDLTASDGRIINCSYYVFNESNLTKYWDGGHGGSCGYNFTDAINVYHIRYYQPYDSSYTGNIEMILKYYDEETAAYVAVQTIIAQPATMNEFDITCDVMANKWILAKVNYDSQIFHPAFIEFTGYALGNVGTVTLLDTQTNVKNLWSSDKITTELNAIKETLPTEDQITLLSKFKDTEGTLTYNNGNFNANVSEEENNVIEVKDDGIYVKPTNITYLTSYKDETVLWEGAQSSTGDITINDSYANYDELSFVFSVEKTASVSYGVYQLHIDTSYCANQQMLGFFGYDTRQFQGYFSDETTFHIGTASFPTLLKIIGIKNKANANNIAQLYQGYEDYSSEEICIGKWINGKPLYRKIVPVTISAAHTSDQTIEHGIENLEVSTKIYGSLYSSSLGGSFPIPNYLKSTVYITVWNVTSTTFTYQNAGWVNGTMYVVIEYTKTTDEENSFTPELVSTYQPYESVTTEDIQEVIDMIDE